MGNGYSANLQIKVSEVKTLSVAFVITLTLITDYFFYVTGNYSLIYGLLGGWFFINAILLVITFIYTIIKAINTKHHLFAAIYIAIVFLYSVLLYNVNDLARNHAKKAMGEIVFNVLNSGLHEDMYFTKDTEKKFNELSRLQYDLTFETFIPTRRRIDYLVQAENGKTFRLTVIKRWNNSSYVYLNETPLHK